MESDENFDFNQDRPIDDVNMSEDDGGGNREDEAQEDRNNPAGEAIKPKRIVKNPQPKLDANRLMGPRGIGILPSTFKGTIFKEKGYEKEDLNLLMKKLEHWAHRLFPKLTFDDTLKQIEKLGSKKPVQSLVRRIRLDMYQNDEIVDEPENAATDNSNAVEEVDVFDEILGTGPYATNKNMPLTGNTNIGHLTDLILPATPIVSPRPASQKQMTLTDEQKERIERNKRLAAERRKAKMLEQRNCTEVMEEGCDDTSQNFSSLLKIPNSNPEIINANETIRAVGEAASSTLLPVPSIELFDPSCSSKLETVPPNESTNLGEILCNNKQKTDRPNSNSNDSLNADLVTAKSSEICTEEDILALMDNDL